MAASSFPQRKSAGAGGMTSGGGGAPEVLDQPPPSPVMANTSGTLPMGQGASQPMPSFAQMAQPMTAGTPGRAVSPEVSMGIMQTAETVYGILDSIASIAPDLAMDMAMQKDLLQRSMAKLLVGSGQPGNPSATGVNFPGGGYASGSM